ncbi:hypothetical protein AA0311_2564 [Asaia bogorensis NBRC 16594]|uniref:hypothetical protein n=1 Tax=Asaia bogorensis TaxID=91915 RepID=UPI002156B289|nr:hypothetical protein [Asaia bogorensis]GBQ81219.1 hypothetical protein AA0311_2564 [Asaia bogorensis NBRC 16594]
MSFESLADREYALEAGRVRTDCAWVLRLRTHSQNMTVAARQMAEKKTVGHLS